MNKLSAFMMVMILSAGGLMAQNKKPATAKSVAAKPSGKPSLEKGKVVYTTYCLSCHQADAGGVPNMNPPLIKTQYVLGDKTRLINILLHGLNEDVEINGEVYSNPMPAHDFLKDEDIANVLSFVRNNFTNKASLVTAAEVKKARASTAQSAK